MIQEVLKGQVGQGSGEEEDGRGLPGKPWAPFAVTTVQPSNQPYTEIAHG